MDAFSRSEIDRLGERLGRSPTASDEDARMYTAWSKSFVSAATTVEAEVAALDRVLGGFQVSSRIKQIRSASAKLRRMSTRLSSLEDIAGCRVVAPTLDDIDRLLVELMTLQISRVRDYRSNPHNSYRAVHLTVRDGSGMPVELQLRTEIQHGWAGMAERWAAAIDPALKYGGGPPAEQEALAELAQIGYALDLSRRASSVREQLLNAARASASIRAALGSELDDPGWDPEVRDGRRLVMTVEEFLRLTREGNGD